MIFEDSKVEDSTMMTEESDDDDDFMAKVNVYLTDRQDDDSMVASPGKALGGVLRKSSSSNTKSVKFAIEGDELRQPEVDESKTKQELLSKISRLTELLQEAESVVSLEQSKRKKKERNLVRLAKELKKRNVQQELEKERIEELEEKKRYLEHHWVLAGKELDQEKMLQQKMQKEQQDDYERVLKEEREKLSAVRMTYEKQIQELKRTHYKQCDELSKEVLKATLEADRLHNQLVGSPRSAKMFTSKSSKISLFRSLLFLVLVSLLVLYGRDIRLFTRDATCSPVMPGRVLTRANSPGFFEAPWWAPTMYKKTMHERFCTIAGDASQPVSLQWFNEGQDQRLLVSRGPKVILKKGGLVKAEIYGDSIRSWTKKGYSEEPHSSLW